MVSHAERNAAGRKGSGIQEQTDAEGRYKQYNPVNESVAQLSAGSTAQRSWTAMFQRRAGNNPATASPAPGQYQQPKLDLTESNLAMQDVLSDSHGFMTSWSLREQSITTTNFVVSGTVVPHYDVYAGDNQYVWGSYVLVDETPAENDFFGIGSQFDQNQAQAQAQQYGVDAANGYHGK